MPQAPLARSLAPFTLALTALAGIAGTPVQAGPVEITAPAEPIEEKSIYDKIWQVPVIYKNKDNGFLQEFRFTGRLHVDNYSLDSDLGYDQDWIVRRWRMGFKAKLLQRLDVHVEADLDAQDPRPLYNRLTDAYLAWTFTEAFKLTVGKHSAKFTQDGATSSNALITIDRSNVANNFWFPTEYISGVSLSGKVGEWQYNTGYFSGGTESPEFGNFDAGYFWLGSVGYNFGKALGVKKALLRADYVYNDPNPESDATRSFEQIGSLAFQLDAGKWGVSADVTAGQGFGRQSDAFGAAFMPWFNVTDKLQVVGRYTYVASDENNGVRFNRYENVMTSGRGNEYNELYAGLNYYLYGHKLKVQTGLTYAWMTDDANDGGRYEGWTWTTGLRVSF
jgi:phosphate-selective porin OprO/OprP